MIDFDDLNVSDSQLASDTRADDSDTPKYTCTHCGGSGNYRGVRRHQEKAHCFACGGRGYFKTSPEHREKARKSRAARKFNEDVRKGEEIAQRIIAFREANPEIVQFLRKNSEWSEFFRSLYDQYLERGQLSDKQISAVRSAMAKMEANTQAKAEREANMTTIDLTKIHDLFAVARGNGLKKPRLAVGDLKLSLAPETGRNAGCIYVKQHGEYAGKLTSEGKFYGIRGVDREAIEGQLAEIAKDPLKAATMHGQKTGICSCCSAELTNPESIRLGIGPICRGKWGF